VTWYGPTCVRCKIDILEGTLCDFCEADDARALALAQGEARMLAGPPDDDCDNADDPITQPLNERIP
jgi:hypothetical protein